VLHQGAATGKKYANRVQSSVKANIETPIPTLEDPKNRNVLLFVMKQSNPIADKDGIKNEGNNCQINIQMNVTQKKEKREIPPIVSAFVVTPFKAVNSATFGNTLLKKKNTSWP
jgi:hypothetical protein